MKWKRVLGFAVIACLASRSGFTADSIEHLTLSRVDGSEINAYLEGRHGLEKRGIMLIVQGSMCGSVAPTGNDRLDYQVPASLVRMDIEKYGLTSAQHGDDSAPCPSQYLAHNTIDQRIYDILQVVAYLRGHANWWNGRLYVMGTSEGATVGALAAPLIPETKGIVLINGSIGQPFRDGWADAMADAVAKQGGSAADQADARKEAEETWRKVRANPTPNEQAFGNGNTYLWWASIIDKVPATLLLQTDTPILLMQAELDEMTPLKSARSVHTAFSQAGKHNLTYVELPGLSHGLRQKDGKPGWAPVMDQVTKWVATKEAQP
jgi:pimeloyl-ACP methyl ester carboxylesterase